MKKRNIKRGGLKQKNQNNNKINYILYNMFGRKIARRGRVGVKNVKNNLRLAEKKNHEVHTTANSIADMADDVAAGAGLVGGVAALTGVGEPVALAAGAVGGIAKGVGAVARNVSGFTGAVDKIAGAFR